MSYFDLRITQIPLFDANTTPIDATRASETDEESYPQKFIKETAMRYSAILVLVLAGCGRDPEPQVVKIDMPQIEPNAFLSQYPWATDSTPWGTWVRDPELDDGELRLTVYIRMPDAEPVKRFAGRLKIAGAKGTTIYDEPFAHEPDVSFNLLAVDFLRVEYNDENAAHRALRFEELTATFTPERLMYADGREKDLK